MSTHASLYQAAGAAHRLFRAHRDTAGAHLVAGIADPAVAEVADMLAHDHARAAHAALLEAQQLDREAVRA